MASQAKTVLTKIQKARFKTWDVAFWLVKRRLENKEAVYSVVRVEVDAKLGGRLKGAVTRKVSAKDIILEEYDFLSADQDDRIFTLETETTDFARIQGEIDKGLANKRASTFNDLLDSWAYVIELRNVDQIIYGVRKISALTQAKKVDSLTSLFFRDHLLVDLADEKVLTLDLNLDFVVSEGIAFIAHKRDFEAALNFRRGMEENRDTVLSDFAASGYFTDIEPMRKHIGSNLHHLRKISGIQKSAYYKDKVFMKTLIRVNVEQGWGLEIVDGKIALTEGNIDTVLTLLNNSRLISLINEEMFDAILKKKVG